MIYLEYYYSDPYKGYGFAGWTGKVSNKKEENTYESSWKEVSKEEVQKIINNNQWTIDFYTEFNKSLTLALVGESK